MFQPVGGASLPVTSSYEAQSQAQFAAALTQAPAREDPNDDGPTREQGHKPNVTGPVDPLAPDPLAVEGLRAAPPDWVVPPSNGWQPDPGGVWQPPSDNGTTYK